MEGCRSIECTTMKERKSFYAKNVEFFFFFLGSLKKISTRYCNSFIDGQSNVWSSHKIHGRHHRRRDSATIERGGREKVFVRVQGSIFRFACACVVLF